MEPDHQEPPDRLNVIALKRLLASKLRENIVLGEMEREFAYSVFRDEVAPASHLLLSQLHRNVKHKPSLSLPGSPGSRAPPVLAEVLHDAEDRARW